jgi:two-component system chemotaxis sensor kinase CheA
MHSWTPAVLFDAGDGTTMAVPLALVARLEEFPRKSVERSGDKRVVQYRGDLLPLQPVNGYSADDSGSESQSVIVFSEGRRSMGLMVNEIQDIIEERLIIRMQSQRKGVLGTAIINGQATDVIDTNYYVTQVNPTWFSRGRERRESRRVLVVDDSLFFRQLVTTALESENYRVSLAESAVQAMERIEHGERYDVIISDIEMPQMDGIEFAKRLRLRTDSRDVPLIAVSSLAAGAYEPKALEAGFNRYLVKFNAQQLLSAIEELSGLDADSRMGVSA